MLNRMSMQLILTFVSLTLAGQASGQSALRAVDVYGTDSLTVEDLESLVGDELHYLADHYQDRRSDEYVKVKEELNVRIREHADAAFVQVTVIELYTADHPVYITVDVVTAEDQQRRMNFLPAPTMDIDDPEELIVSWQEYERISSELFRAGELPNIRTNAHHSLWGFSHESLRDYGERFDRDVPIHKAELVDVLCNARDPNKRASAAFLLAHIEDPDELIEILTPQIADPHPTVRNNVMRVLASVARNHPRVPLHPVITALDYPTATDRNKALAIVRFLVEDEQSKRDVIEGAGTALVRMLQLTQPINHNLSYVVLQRISGESYDATDYVSWNRWLDEQR